MAAQFVDLSSNNPLPNLSAMAAAGVDLVVLKATEGTGYTWSAHRSLANAAHALGMRVGHYHFNQPGYSTPAAQAGYFLNEIRPVWAAGDVAVMDDEVSGGLSAQALTDWGEAFLGQVDDDRGQHTWRYSSYSWLASRAPMLAAMRDSQRPWWTAAYQSTRPDALGCHQVAWQYTSDATDFPGTSGRTDVSHLLIPDVLPAGGGSLLTMPLTDDDKAWLSAAIGGAAGTVKYDAIFIIPTDTDPRAGSVGVNFGRGYIHVPPEWHEMLLRHSMYAPGAPRGINAAEWDYYMAGGADLDGQLASAAAILTDPAGGVLARLAALQAAIATPPPPGAEGTVPVIDPAVKADIATMAKAFASLATELEGKAA